MLGIGSELETYDTSPSQWRHLASCPKESLEHRSKGFLTRPRVDERAGHAAMVEGLFDEQDISGLPVEPGREIVPEAMWGDQTDAGNAGPVGESAGDVPCGQMPTTLPRKERSGSPAG